MAATCPAVGERPAATRSARPPILAARRGRLTSARCGMAGTATVSPPADRGGSPGSKKQRGNRPRRYFHGRRQADKPLADEAQPAPVGSGARSRAGGGGSARARGAGSERACGEFLGGVCAL